MVSKVVGELPTLDRTRVELKAHSHRRKVANRSTDAKPQKSAKSNSVKFDIMKAYVCFVALAILLGCTAAQDSGKRYL